MFSSSKGSNGHIIKKTGAIKLMPSSLSNRSLMMPPNSFHSLSAETSPKLKSQKLFERMQATAFISYPQRQCKAP